MFLNKVPTKRQSTNMKLNTHTTGARMTVATRSTTTARLPWHPSSPTTIFLLKWLDPLVTKVLQAGQRLAVLPPLKRTIHPQATTLLHGHPGNLACTTW